MICFPQQWISMLPKPSSPLPLGVAQKYLISWWANPLGSSRAVCAVTWMPVRVRGNWWVGPISLAVGTAQQRHRPCGTARGSLKKGFLCILGVDADMGSEGGRDKAQILRWKAIFYVLTTSPVPLLTFPEDLFHMLNNVPLHCHNRDSQPKGLKD